MSPVAKSSALPALPALRLHGLRCQRGGRMLFGAFSAELAPGQTAWLRGTNGSGKTTLLRVLAGLGRAAEGGVEAPQERLYLGHANALKEDLTVQESLQWAATLAQASVTAQGLTDALQRFGLTRLRQRPVRTLSQGQRRRTALARLALPQRPGALWLLDEPFDALDTEGVAALVACIQAHSQAGGAVVFTSHQPIAALDAQVWTLPEGRA